MIRQVKKHFFSNLNAHDVTDDKTFWKTVKPLLAGKVKTKSKITLIGKKYKDQSTKYSEEIISGVKKASEIFNNVNVKILQTANCMINYLFRIFDYN